MRNEIIIGSRRVGPGEPCFVIAEAGVNHNGDRSLALKLVDVAAASGADAVKFQTFAAERLATPDAPKADYQIETTGAAESQFAMLKRLELSFDDHVAVKARCEERGILFLSTPFDERSADMLQTLGVAAFKTPSGELTNLPYLAHVARFGKPMIVSTGMATLGEVEAAVASILANGAPPTALLHCVSKYPAEPEDVNLRAMETLSRAFGLPVGYSDHTRGVAVGIAAAALGACVVEKHFTIDRSLPGPDHRASLEPDELRTFVDGIRSAQAALGDGQKRPREGELATAAVARKSLVAVRDLVRGAVLESSDVRAMRPGTGIPPADLQRVCGRRLTADIRAGTLLEWGMFA
jgi:N-acetylneuraminate synthase/N,N'-diacetyllegionaminate synthase